MSGKDRIVPGLEKAVASSGDGSFIKLKVKPKSGRFKITKLEGDKLYVSLKSQPEKGKANQELISNLARIFGVKGTDILITSGLRSRHKTILVSSKKSADLVKLLSDEI